ncbi:hypothetical protein TRFO_05969 [Tritrichomonas foetus]|uniref:PPM-type phosphatase domain-containing protein n=1 Tax=Tritrichomonas foetus TaxID=1144522 RepID=A0A1J4K7I8_9EUKA|nr:hypothetical protein TRFO_05969 [Tritrichomonas foetus]|eukprot:OHT05381.1 hypothetical protein TRFO_05969 [Tritrichomonas foetus]
MSQRLPFPIPSPNKIRPLSLKRLGSEFNFYRRSSSQVTKNDTPLVPSEQKKLDLVGRIEELKLPLPAVLQVLDLSENPGLSSDFVFQLNIPTLQTLRLNHCDIVVLPENPPPMASTIRILSLDGNHLNSIPEWIFKMPELNELSLFGNEIETIEFPENTHLIKILNLSYNPLIEVKSHSNFNVQLLNLTQTKLKEIPHLPLLNLKTLCLVRCCISGYLDFQVFYKLAYLDLSFNQIESLSDAFVDSCQCLCQLNLSNNLLKSLPESFVCPPEMTKINLSNNFLTSIPKSFLNSIKLENMNLSNNKITNLEPFRFRQLRNLNLSNNLLTELPDCFEISNYLTVLNIAFNQITDLPHSLVSCNEMLELNCTSNKFDHFPPVVFSLGNLRTLVFAGNIITTIPDSLSGLFKLQNFDLSNNHVISLPLFIQRLPELKTLSFSHNRITEVTNITFPQRLQSIDLSFNLIEKFKINPLALLENLSLQYNKLTDISFNMTDFPSIQFFSIACNDLLGGKLDFVENSSAEVEFFGNEDIEFHKRERNHSTDAFPSDRFGVGIAATLGSRKTMEDSFTVASTDNSDFFLIFDGHAGPSAARLLSDYIGGTIEQIENADNIPEAIDDILFRGNEYIRSFNIIDGTTAAGAFVKNNTAYVFGIGDSRVLRVTQENHIKSEQLTIDHKPTNPSEFERLRNEGFNISAEGRISRKLAVSRALGDFWCNNNTKKYQGLFIKPEIIQINLSEEEDVGFVIACDGLWDVLSNTEVAKIVRKAETAVDAAVTLKNLAIASGSQDNVSVIVVLWKPKEGDEGISPRNTVEELPPYEEEVIVTPQVITQLPVRNRRRR